MLKVALSFDIEEFDLPLEHGFDFPFERQIEVSRQGAMVILDILEKYKVRATFFSTVAFARNAPDVIDRLIVAGHELASHGMCHTTFESSHLADSRLILEEISKREIIGFRMPRMMKLPEREIAEAGYSYDASLNPTFIPGRYMNLNRPRRPFIDSGIVQIPASVTPFLRFPLFWLALHLLPAPVYRALSRYTLHHDKSLNTYFHPWEFYDLNSFTDIKLPGMVRLHSGDEMRKRLEKFILSVQNEGATFVTYSDLFREIKKK